MITNDEAKQIKDKLSVIMSQEQSLNLDLKEYEEDCTHLRKIFDELNIFNLAHMYYHFIQDEFDCHVASNSVALKLFLTGYACRKAIEDEKRLTQLISSVDA